MWYKLLTSLPWLLLLTLALGGLVLLVWGRPYRRALPAPHCGRCGYSLWGLLSERCPECGSRIAEVGETYYRWKCRPVLLLIGVFLLLPLVGIPIGLGRRGTDQLSGLRYMPAALLLRQTQSPDPRLGWSAYNELLRRFLAGSLGDDHTRELARVVVADCTRQPPPDDALLFIISDILGRLMAARCLTPEQEGQLFDRLFEATMEAPPTAVRSKGIPVLLRLRTRIPIERGLRAGIPVIRMARDRREPDLPPSPLGRLPDVPLDGIENFVVGHAPIAQAALTEQACSLFTPTVQSPLERGFTIIVQDSGPCEMVFAIAIDIYYRRPGFQLPEQHRYRWTRSFTLKSEVLADPLPAQPKQVGYDGSLDGLVDACVNVKARELPATQPSGSGGGQIDVQIEALNPPLALGFSVEIENDRGKHYVGDFVALPNVSVTTSHVMVASGPVAPASINVVLAPHPSLLDGQAYEAYCGSSLQLRNVPVEPASRPASAP